MMAAVHETSMQSAGHLRLSWVLRLRWATFMSQLMVLLVSATFMPHTGAPAVVVVALSAILNLVVGQVLARRRDVSELVVTLAVVTDVALLTALLALTGGPSNPFTLLYVVHLATSTISLSRRYALGVAAAVAVAWASLFWVSGPGFHVHPSDGPAFAAHVRGTWVAFGLTAVLLVVFLGEMHKALAARERDSEKARRVASLATLAGGAAHELATPLSTIAVVAGELAARLKTSGDQALVDDAVLLLQEVMRCKAVLLQMTVDAGAPAGEPSAQTSVAELVTDATAGLPRVQLKVERDVSLALPKRALTSAVRGLVKNALQADPGVVVVTVDASVGVRSGNGVGVRSGNGVGACTITVIDQGTGMPASVLARIGEPFFTTKDAGAGMGLGVFLATAVAEQCGGRLAFTSTPGRGTRACLELPWPT